MITWNNPADILSGTALSSTQLNAQASVPGAFTYNPPVGTVLSVGTHTLHVDFTPTDTVNYNAASKDVTINVINVQKTTPTITWNNPAEITYGTTLNDAQLNAVASVPGTFTYTPPAGTILAVGTHTLHVDFTPSDPAAYNIASADVQINVVAAPLKTPIITWNKPADISYGTALDNTQLNAVATDPVSGATVAGTFTYTPAERTVLNAGTQTLHVDFIPSDITTYTPASKDVAINVQKATPTVTWNNPADIRDKTALSDAQLNAIASIPGAFTYTPPAGTTLNTGTQTLKVDFTPNDTTNYNTVSKTVTINVLSNNGNGNTNGNNGNGNNGNNGNHGNGNNGNGHNQRK